MVMDIIGSKPLSIESVSKTEFFCCTVERLVPFPSRVTLGQNERPTTDTAVGGIKLFDRGDKPIRTR